MVNVVEVILVPALMILVGVLLKRFNVLREEHSSVLSKIVLNISLPSLIFMNIATAHIGGNMLYLPVFSFGLSFICVIIGYVYSKLRGYSKVKTWTVIILLSMMNTAFVGYPIVLGVFGNEGFLHAIFYDMAVAILFVIYGVVLSSVFGGNRRDVLVSGLLFVPLWAIVFGVLFNFFNVPLGYVFENVLTYLGNSTIPLIMLSLGLTISVKDLRSYLSDTVFISVVRLIVAPLILFVILSSLNFDGLMLQVSVLEAAMPTAMNALVLAITYDLDVELVSSVVFITTILCLFTLPLIIGVII
ncbi:MAG: hypothetical protein BZ135_05605 [Methanosphaera sp. rholeuAM6]|nr:MAG: hypothetical protein BZ135_05605 [Methanosphaera sp. rholeuAM6]